ncbi:MAG: DUF6029 family protein [Myxococcota bacterium]
MSGTRRSFALAAAVLALALSLPASAIDLGARKDGAPIVLDVTESLLLDFHTKLDDPALAVAPENVFDLRNRLNLRLRAGWLSAGMRLDAAWFPDPPSGQYRNDLRVEELYFTARKGGFTLTAGDDYVALGRGMALALRKVDEVGFDVTLRGAHAGFRSSKFAARVDAGITNVVNVDGVEEKRVPDPHDLVVSGRVEYSPTPKLRFALHGVDIERRHSPLSKTLVQPFDVLARDDLEPTPISGERFIRSWIVGGSFEALSLAERVSLYAEFDYLTTRSSREALSGTVDSVRHGYALYGSATVFAGPVTLLAEAKHYDQFELASTPHPQTAQSLGITTTFPYNAPPTLERAGQRIANNTDVSGAHIRLDYRLRKSEGGNRQNVFVSAAGFLDAPEQGHTTVHGYAGWDYKHARGHRVQLQAGTRLEQAPSGSDVGLRMVHLDADAFVLLGARHDLQFHWSHEFHDKNPKASITRDRYVEGTAYVTWDFTPHWAFTAQLDYLTSDDRSGSPVFPGAWVMYRFDQSSFIRVFGGRSKGGLKCSGGICRIFPDFEGVKLEATVRF